MHLCRQTLGMSRSHHILRNKRYLIYKKPNHLICLISYKYYRKFRVRTKDAVSFIFVSRSRHVNMQANQDFVLVINSILPRMSAVYF